MKLRLLLLSLFALAGSAAAQFTIVSGTVTDPNGIPYANGTITPTLVTSASPTFTSGGAAYTPPGQSVNLDGTGSFTMRLADNTALSPASTKWNFTVCSGAGTVQPAIGTGPVCFSLASAITISGSSQSISSNLNAVALALTNAATTTGTIGGNSGSAGAIAEYAAASGSRAITPDSLLTDSGTALTYTGGPLRVPAGSAAAPSLAPRETGTGMWSGATSQLDWSLGGTDRMQLLNGGLAVNGNFSDWSTGLTHLNVLAALVSVTASGGVTPNLGFGTNGAQHFVTAAANNDMAGTVTLSTGSGSYSFGHGWGSAPVCVCTDQTAANAVKCATSTTTLTITGTSSDVIAYVCIGNPN